ncbi:Hypothetical predicted protein [Olea europaea subsp. europaea]|uniref:Uncharacterized protein n=1 Tax=Olea europaea subsp. europaea TaxID=158383 RepID=A0A8S0VGC9_OLEEU|nr:Hypothetical predicted protein [Olea europaea subsp. europaea]
MGVAKWSVCRCLDYEEDPDFVRSDVDTASEEDDLLYERNVTDGIEIGSDMNSGRNKGGKMVSSRGRGLSSIEIPNAQEPMRFIPTPTVARDTGRSGPIASALADSS